MGAEAGIAPQGQQTDHNHQGQGQNHHHQALLARFLIDGHKHDAIVLQTLQPQEYPHDTEVEKQHDNRCQPIESTPILLGLIIEG